jgi:hypothetical protein
MAFKNLSILVKVGIIEKSVDLLPYEVLWGLVRGYVE